LTVITLGVTIKALDQKFQVFGHVSVIEGRGRQAVYKHRHDRAPEVATVGNRNEVDRS